MSGETWDYEALRSHIQVQLARIEALNEQRAKQFQRELDQRLKGIYTKVSDQRDFFSQRMADADKAIQAALISAEKAVTKAEEAAEKRFECVASDVLILCADRTWRPAGDLRPGDELIACDETATARRARRFRRSVVTANEEKRDVLLRVTTSAGAVRCNSQHPWLARRDSTGQPGRPNWRWVTTADLRPGDSVLHAVGTWDADRSWEGQAIASHGRAAAVTSVEGDGTGMIAALSTSTHTYIAGGFIMHNSVNEFRQSLSDQTATFIPRVEYDGAHNALIERISGMAERMSALELRLTSRLDLGQGSSAGAGAERAENRQVRDEHRQDHAQGISQAVVTFMGVSILVSVVAIILSIALHKP